MPSVTAAAPATHPAAASLSPSLAITLPAASLMTPVVESTVQLTPSLTPDTIEHTVEMRGSEHGPPPLARAGAAGTMRRPKIRTTSARTSPARLMAAQGTGGTTLLSYRTAERRGRQRDQRNLRSRVRQRAASDLSRNER